MSSDNTANNKENANPMTKEDASRIQAAEAKSGTGETPADSFATRAQSAADKNEQDKKPAVAVPAEGGTGPSGGDQMTSLI